MIAPEAEALGFALVRVRLFGKGDERTLQVMAERPDTRERAMRRPARPVGSTLSPSPNSSSNSFSPGRSPV